MAYYFDEKKDENVLNVRKAVNGVRVSLIQCDDGTYTFRVEASGLKRTEEFLDNYSNYCAYIKIAEAYVKAASGEEPKEEAAEEEETEGEG